MHIINGRKEKKAFRISNEITRISLISRNNFSLTLFRNIHVFAAKGLRLPQERKIETQ